MPKETFGGDDEGDAGGEERKKLDLSKYDLPPDVNIRDTFWEIMASYAATRKPGVDLSTLENDRFTLMRIALSVLSRPHAAEYGLSPKFLARYSFMMLLDGQWDDALLQFMEKGLESRQSEEVRNALAYMLTQEGYQERLGEHLNRMLRSKEGVDTAIAFLAASKDAGLARSMRREVIIIARGDIGDNQMNAIRVLGLMREEEDAKKALIAILSHWDDAARLEAALALEGMDDEEVAKAAEARLKKETSEEVLEALRRV
jgi:2-oxo-4-hydroxy-4-carboxy--5-ureidoimidazoline (OHCU) decarboxylase